MPTDYVRPTGDSQDFVVEKWIRDKYERKLFCPPDTEPPAIHPQVYLVELAKMLPPECWQPSGQSALARLHTYPSSRKALHPLVALISFQFGVMFLLSTDGFVCYCKKKHPTRLTLNM